MVMTRVLIENVTATTVNSDDDNAITKEELGMQVNKV